MKIKPFHLLSNLLTTGLAFIALLLVVSVLPLTGGFKILAVLSGSMEPHIHVGGIVAISPKPSYQVGDVITFSQKDGEKIPITHRVVDIQLSAGRPVYLTKGDANNISDPQQVFINEIWGKMIFTLPYLGYLINFAKQPLGFMFLVVVPAVVIIYDEIQKIKNEITQLKNKKKKTPPATAVPDA